MKKNKHMPKPRKTTITDLERLYNALLSRLDALELAFDIAQRTQEAKGKKAKQVCRDLEKASQAIRAFFNAAFDKDGKAFVLKGTQTGRATIGKGLLPVLVDSVPYGVKECEALSVADATIVVGDVVEALGTAGTPLQPGFLYNVVQLLSTKVLLLQNVRTKERFATSQLEHLELAERKLDDIGTARREWLEKDNKALLEKDKKRFPVGSLVRCVKSSDHLGDDADMEEGLIYTVREHMVFGQPGGQWLELKLVGNPFNWATNRFEPVETPKAKKVKPVKSKKGKDCLRCLLSYQRLKKQPVEHLAVVKD